MDSAVVPSIPLIPSDEERLLREAVAGIASSYGPAYIRSKHDAGLPPSELWDALAEKGYLGVNIPEEYGGGGRGMTELAAVGEELAAAGCSLLLLVVSPAIAGSILARHGSEDQKDRWLRGIGAGTTKIAFAVTEPDAGTNTHKITTRATPDGNGGYRIRGQKVFISGVEDAEALMVVARMEVGGGAGGRHVAAGGGAPIDLGVFIVDTDAEGLSRTEIPTAPKGADKQWQLFFEDVEVGDDRRVANGLGALFDGLNPERIMAAALAVGAGRLALAKASQYARERTVWSVPIGAHQGLSHPLAECKIELELAALMLRKASALYDAGTLPTRLAGEASNMAKYAAAEAAIRCVDQAIQTHGGNGVAEEYGLSDERIPPAVRTMRIAGGRGGFAR
jgi:alkylation response protein AidB-like acyl-CoA dehydrogenase